MDHAITVGMVIDTLAALGIGGVALVLLVVALSVFASGFDH